MLKVLALFMVFGIFILFDLPRLLTAVNKKKMWMVYGMLLGIGMGISLIVLFEIKMATPSTLIETLLKTVLRI